MALGRAHTIRIACALAAVASVCSSCSPCPAGMVPGGCGLDGLCIECLTDADCESPLTCTLRGTCMIEEDWCHSDIDCDFMYEQAVCLYSRCAIPCESIIDCPYGQECRGLCMTERCQPDGTCPEGWEPNEGSLGCHHDPCSARGLVLGGCGLAGTCVECLTDADCEGAHCDLQGRCGPPGCLTDEDCGPDMRCIRGLCVSSCADAQECPEDRICDPVSMTCQPVICDEYGECGQWGWQPVEGTLACVYDPCQWKPGKIPGVCGCAETCVECVVDADCAAGQVCNMHGEFRDAPECEQDRDCVWYGEVCADGECRKACESDADCKGGRGICMQAGFCTFERCSAEGTCPEGWVPSSPELFPGMLACYRAW